MAKVAVADLKNLQDKIPAYALVANVDLVVIRFEEEVSVLYGRCPHRGALLSDGSIEGANLICGVHRWDFRWDFLWESPFLAKENFVETVAHHPT